MRRATAICDRIVLGGLCLLVLATPLAFGSVHRPAYLTLEVAVGALCAVAALKVALAGPPFGRRAMLPRSLWLPAACFLAIGALQLVPLPPSWLGAISPSSYGVLERSLPGWPAKPPYADLAARARQGDAVVQASAESGPAAAIRPAGPDVSLPIRRPLSLLPARTAETLLKAGAYLGVFFLVLLYPWNGGGAGEQRALRALVRALAGAAVLVAALALVQRATWNGRILWFFIPHDWPAGVPDPRPRTCGPFISRNSLAGYLALLLPLLVVLATSRTSPFRRSRAVPFRAASAAAVGVAALALVLTLSRAGLIAAAAGLGCLAALLRRLPTDAPMGAGGRAAGSLRGALALAFAAALGALLAGVGDGALRDVDLRIDQTIHDSASWDARLGYWRDALAQARDFPLLGAGLGAWPEVAPRYDSAPRAGTTPRAAHNDHLQLLAETGLAGALAAALLLVAVARRIARSLERRSPSGGPLAAAALAGLVAVVLHSAVDFDLQIPAIPLALAILLATALRPALPRRRPPAVDRARQLAYIGAGAAVGAIVLALAQPAEVDPLRVPAPASLAGALRLVSARPASAAPHLRLYATGRERLPADLRRRELEIARWLAPRDPRPRDALAGEWALAGRQERALEEVAAAVALAPRTRDHPYLAEGVVERLSAVETAAIELGLRAVLGRDADAPRTLARMLAARGRPGEGASVLLSAAGGGSLSTRERVALFVEAADLSLRAGSAAQAETAARQALAAAPASTAAHVRLIAARARLRGAAAAEQAARDGITSGADAAELFFAVAEAARSEGDRATQRRMLDLALRARPALAKAHFALGLLEIDEARPEHAVRALRRAVGLAPERVAYWYHLGRAERAGYHLIAARRAFEQALELDPGHVKSRRALAGVEEAIREASGPAAAARTS